MDITDAEMVIDTLDFEFGIEAELRSDYSGRGMYGNTVIAFIVDPGEEIAFGYACGLAGITIGDIPTRTDSMGRRVVIY